MLPWEDVIPQSDLLSFRSRVEAFDRPIDAGSRPALIIVDMTRQFVDSRYPAGWSETGYPAVEANRRLLLAAREAGIPIFFTKGFPSSDYVPTPAQQGRWRGGNQAPPALDPLLPPGDVIVPELTPIEGETLIDKQKKPSGFFGTPLVSMLIYEGVDTTIITGMTTSGCVRATVLDAFQYNFSVVIPHECVADRSQISHKVNLFDMHMKYADVTTIQRTEEYLARVSAKTPTAVR